MVEPTPHNTSVELTSENRLAKKDTINSAKVAQSLQSLPKRESEFCRYSDSDQFAFNENEEASKLLPIRENSLNQNKILASGENGEP